MHDYSDENNGLYFGKIYWKNNLLQLTLFDSKFSFSNRTKPTKNAKELPTNAKPNTTKRNENKGIPITLSGLKKAPIIEL